MGTILDDLGEVFGGVHQSDRLPVVTSAEVGSEVVVAQIKIWDFRGGGGEGGGHWEVLAEDVDERLGKVRPQALLSLLLFLNYNFKDIFTGIWSVCVHDLRNVENVVLQVFEDLSLIDEDLFLIINVELQVEVGLQGVVFG